MPTNSTNMSRRPGSGAVVPRGVLGVLALGAVGTLLAALPYPTFDLERHAVPKELALLLAALLSVWLLVRAARAVAFGWPELALAGYAIWTSAALIGAERWWPGLRATGVTLSGVAIFAAAGTLGRAGRGRLAAGALVLAVTLGCVTALAQAHGVESELFSRSRAPGGVFGNRNFVAHAAVAGLALLVPLVLRARGTVLAVLLVPAVLLAACAILSRSRAAWIAAGAGAIAAVAASFLAGELRRGSPGRIRLALLGAAIGVGGALAVLVPNDLDWRSEAPYLESLRGVADYRSGSGRGRLVQWRHTLEMAQANPLLGVGPGNWSVAYPRFTAPGDPAFAAAQPVPTNPWPSSDWLAIAAERGFPALALLVMAGALLTARAVSRLAGDDERRAGAVGGLALLAVALVVGTFDAQLLLAPPTMLILGGLGALLPIGDDVVRIVLTERQRRRAAVALLATGLLLGTRLMLEATAMHLYEQGGDHRVLAAKVDPGNYRIRALLADRAARAGRCAEARRWAAAARARMPDAPFPGEVLRRCR